MEFRIQAEAFGAALAQLSRVVEKRSTLPILQNVLLNLSGGQLLLTGTDLETQLQHVLPVDAPIDGVITVPADRLLAIVRAWPAFDVSVRLDEDRLRLTGGRSRFQLATLPAEQFPAFDAGAFGEPMMMEAGPLATALDRVAYAMARQDVRYYLNGLLLLLEPGLCRVVASDGHRLAMASFTLAYEGPERQWILPHKFVGNLLKLLSDGV